jgi:hypothetical protein
MAIKQHHALFFAAPLKGWRGAGVLRVGAVVEARLRQKSNTIKNKHSLLFWLLRFWLFNIMATYRTTVRWQLPIMGCWLNEVLISFKPKL